ncbi:hypothetical protein LTR81_025615 [Elasticomyces elasticus]
MARKTGARSSMNANRCNIPADEELWICLDIGGANVRASKCRAGSGTSKLDHSSFERIKRWPGSSKDVDFAPTAVAALNKPDAQGEYGYKWGWDALKSVKTNPTKYTLYTHMKHVLAQSIMDGASDEILYDDAEPDANEECDDGTPIALERKKADKHGHDLDNMARFLITELSTVLLKHAEECAVIVLCSVPCHFDLRRASQYTRNLNLLFPDNTVLRPVDEATAAVLAGARGDEASAPVQGMHTVADCGSTTTDIATLSVATKFIKVVEPRSHWLGSNSINDAADKVLECVEGQLALDRCRELVEEAKSNIADVGDLDLLPTVDPQTWERLWAEVRKQDNELNLKRGEVVLAHLKEHNKDGTITLTRGASSSTTLRVHLEKTLRAAVPGVELHFVADDYESSASRKSFDHVLHGLQLVAKDPSHATASTASHNLFVVDHLNGSMDKEEVRYIWAWKLGAAFDEISTQPEIQWKPTQPIPMWLTIAPGPDEQFEIDLSFSTSVTQPKLCDRDVRGAFNVTNDANLTWRARVNRTLPISLPPPKKTPKKTPKKKPSNAPRHAWAYVWVVPYARELRIVVVCHETGKKLSALDDMQLGDILRGGGAGVTFLPKVLTSLGSLQYTEFRQQMLLSTKKRKNGPESLAAPGPKKNMREKMQ